MNGICLATQSLLYHWTGKCTSEEIKTDSNVRCDIWRCFLCTVSVCACKSELFSVWQYNKTKIANCYINKLAANLTKINFVDKKNPVWLWTYRRNTTQFSDRHLTSFMSVFTCGWFHCSKVKEFNLRSEDSAKLILHFPWQLQSYLYRILRTRQGERTGREEYTIEYAIWGLPMRWPGCGLQKLWPSNGRVPGQLYCSRATHLRRLTNHIHLVPATFNTSPDVVRSYHLYSVTE